MGTGPLAQEDALLVQLTPTQARRTVIAASMGTFIEWLEYASYAYLATTIAAVFFEESDASVALLQTLGVFALSFLMRPIGGLFWGHFGDRIGRQRTLAISIIGMGVATGAIGVMPAYETIGVTAPVLLLVFRMTQSFCAAGEYSGAAVLLAEHAPEHRRARWVSAVPIATAAGFLTASFLVTFLTGALSSEAMHEWGWRVPFLLTVPLTAVAWYIRRHVDESPVFRALQEHQEVPARPLRDGLLKHWRPMLRMLGVMSVNAGGYYLVLAYMATYIQTELGLNAFQSNMIVTAGLLAYLPLLYACAALADKFGRRNILLANCALFLLLSYPAFALLGVSGFLGILAIQLVLVAVFSLNDSTFATYFVEAFPTNVRFTGFALPFNVGVALFGGVSPLLAAWLIDKTGNTLAPAFLILAYSAVAALALLTQRDPHTAIEDTK